MEFMGIAVGILALICALVLLFGQRGARRVLGWGAVAIIAAVALFASGAVFYAWTDAGVAFYFWTVETLKTLKDMTIGAGILALICALVLPFGLRGARVLITVIAAAAIFYAGVTVQSHYTVLSDAQVGLTNNQSWRNDPIVTSAPTPKLLSDAQVGLSDAQVGLTNNQPTCFSGLQRVPCPTNNQPTWKNAPVVAPPFDPSKPYEVVGPPAAPTGLYERLIAEEDQRIAWTNSHTPIKLDGPIKLTHASRLENLETMEYEVAFPADKWTDDHRADITRITTNENCNRYKDTRKMLDLGFRIRHVFRDQSGLLAYSITITKYSCSQVNN